MNLWQITLLAIIQGAAELLPVSSSAHVIVAEKLMGLDPTTPQLTLLLVMLHTGTMFAVIVYFWKSWRTTYFSSVSGFRRNAARIVIATAATGVVGLLMLEVLKHAFARNGADFEVEQLFGNLRLVATALAVAGLLIIGASVMRRSALKPMSRAAAGWIGASQGLCLPLRGLSRSGTTISLGLMLGISRREAEEFSFALGVVLTPVVIFQEAHRLLKANPTGGSLDLAGITQLIAPGLGGMALSFLAGLLALRWLSRWLEQGRWYLFGAYCLVAAALVLRVA
jgi:undecaprenyl-diphosphatase